MTAKGVRTFLLVLMDVFFLVAVLDVARVVVRFFGTLAGTSVGERYTELTQYIVIPFGIDPLSTPYGGLFDINATITVAILLVVEWALAVSRKRL